MKHLSFRGPIERSQDMEQGRLPHAGGAYNGHPLSLEKSEVNSLQDLHFLVPVSKRFKKLLGLNRFLHTMDSFALSALP